MSSLVKWTNTEPPSEWLNETIRGSMRFLLLTQYFPPEVGAPQVRLLALCQQLKAHGHEVTVATAMPNYPVGVVQAGYAGRFLVTEEVEGVPVIRTWIYAAA